jgi:hypothetical protein
MRQVLLIAALAVFLSACGEQPQTLAPVGKDLSPYTGTGKAFAVSGWKQGDKAAWESQLKARTQQGQNDYGRMN